MKRWILFLVIFVYLSVLYSKNITKVLDKRDFLSVWDVPSNYIEKSNDLEYTSGIMKSLFSSIAGLQIINAYDSGNNNILVNSSIIDTLFATATGSSNPPQDPNGGVVINGDFEIESTGVNTITGDGIDEETHWRFIFNLPQNDPTLEIISAFLTMRLTPMDPSADNDGVWFRGCNCGQIDVGAHTLFQEYTFETEMLDVFPAQFIIDSLLAGGGISLGYQDDAIVSFAELRLIINSSSILVNHPQAGELWIAGETDTIKWNGGASGQFFNIEFSIDNGNTYSLITIGVPADSGYYIWNIPQNILSAKVKIKISDFADSTTFVVSDLFKIKGYVLTKYLPNGDYKPYSMVTDSWGFANNSNNVWPNTWWQQFDYQGTDPFTGSQYSQWQGDYVFATSVSSEHPDWPAFVNTFGTSECYRNTTLSLYSSTALSRWESVNNFWAGSCFGIAISNYLAYENKISFRNRYPNFPDFVNASLVSSNPNTIPVINELFTHQFGNPHRDYRSNIALNKTPNQTLNDLKQIFIKDSVQLQTLSFLNNPPGTGGHAILAYKVEKDTITPTIFYVYVYDNSYPDSLNARIVFNTSANGGNGSWSFNHWPTWGGNKWIYLRDPVSNYLSTPTINRGTFQHSPFIVGDNLLRVNTGIDASVRIQDDNGNVTGYINGSVELDIPNSTPLIVDNGSETPPYGYELPADNYLVTLNNFTLEKTKAFFFIGNKTFSYERSGVTQTQSDNLFFDGGVSATNNNAESKLVSLLNIINETSQEKLFVVRSIELAQNDSVKIENPDSNKLKLISYGSAKDYDVELNFVTDTGIGRFGDFNIPLSANTSHTFIPDWTDLTNTDLVVLVDIGNDGTIDDTLSLINQVTGIGDDQGSLPSPNSYNLAQNYPNPFNPVTTIQYSIPQHSNVTLKVYDVLGNEVSTLVNEEKESGVFTATFDASGLASGIYLYKLQAGSFVETKKMILLK